MKLFKNEVGRPSNETLKKRKMIIIAIVIAAVLLVGGVTFALVRTLKPIEGSGKKAEANRFVVAKNSNTCYTVYAPTNAKYWGVHVYYKQAGSSSFGSRKISSLSKYHDNDGVKSQKICFKKQKYENETFRILVKWNKGSNHKVYKTPNAWKPNGYYANNAIGWAYKDYAINWGTSSNSNNQATKAALTVTGPSQVSYTKTTTVKISFKHNQNKTMYYTFVNYNNGVSGYKQSCSPINANQTKSFTLDVNAKNPRRYSAIKLFSDSSCSKQVDSKTTKTYKYTASPKLEFKEVTTTTFTKDTSVNVMYSHNQNKTMYVKFDNYNNGTKNYSEKNCIALKANEIKSVGLKVDKTYSSRYSIVKLYSDSKCSNQVDSKTTKTYNYKFYANLIVSEPATKKYTSAQTVKINFSTDTNYDKLYYLYKIYWVNRNNKPIYDKSGGCYRIKKGEKGYLDLSLGPNHENIPNHENGYATIEIFKDSKCTMKNRVAYKKTSNYIFHSTIEKPYIKNACQKNGYVYVTANDNGIITFGQVTARRTKCNKNNAQRINKKTINQFRLNKKLTSQEGQKVCLWDEDNNLQEKWVDKACK